MKSRVTGLYEQIGDDTREWRYVAACDHCRWFWGLAGSPVPWDVVHEVASQHTWIYHLEET